MAKIKEGEKLAFLIILLFSAILRLFSLNQSFWLDEAVQVWASSSFSPKDLLLRYMPGDFNPPLYHLLLHFWIRVVGVSEPGVRLFSVALGVATVWLVWKTAKELGFGSRKRLVAALLLATSPPHIYYSQEARMYILASFGAVFAVWRYLVFCQKPSWLNSALFAVGLLIMGFSHFLTLLLLPIFAFFIIEKFKASGRFSFLKFAKWSFGFGLLLLGYLVYFPLFLRQLRTGMGWREKFPVWGETVGSFTLKAAGLLPVKFVIGRISIENKIIYGLVSLVLVFIFWGLVARGWLGSLKLRVEKTKFQLKIKNWKIFFLFCLLLLPPILGFLVSFWIPIFSYFRFVYLLPFFYLLIAEGLGELGKLGKVENLRGAVLIFLVGVNLICSGVYLFNSKFQREDWRGMVEWLQKRNWDYGAPVLILPQISKPFEYYDQKRSNMVYIDPSAPQNLHSLIHRNWEQVYLVSYGLGIFDPQGKIREELEKMGYKIKKGRSFRGVGIEEWGASN